MLLLGTGKLTDSLKESASFADRSADAAAVLLLAEKLINGDVEYLRQLLDLIRSQSYRITFPSSVTRLTDPEFFRDLSLRKSQGFARDPDTFTERRTRTIRRSACLHGGIIPPI